MIYEHVVLQNILQLPLRGLVIILSKFVVRGLSNDWVQCKVDIMCFVPVLGTKCINPPFGTRTPKVGTNYINPFYFMGDWETRTPKVLDTKCMNPPKCWVQNA